MELIPNLTVDEVQREGHLQGELQQFINQYSGQTLKCSVCNTPFTIDRTSFHITLHVSESLFEKLQAKAGFDVYRQGVSEDTKQSDLRVSNSVKAHAIIKCPDCTTGYGSHDKYWEQLLQ